MKLQDTLELHVKAAVKELFQADLESVEFQATRKEFAGDITVVVFPMLRVVKGNPVAIGEQIGQYLKDNVALVKGFNVVKGFLNIEIDDSYYIDFFNSIKDQNNYGFASLKDDKAVMVEYSSPNTNKPLHLGHVRNVLLGYSVSEILKASGKKVYKTQIINDRGIHICKSMLAWKKFADTGIDGERETAEVIDLEKDQHHNEKNKKKEKDREEGMDPEEIEKREAEEQRRMALEQALEDPLTKGLVTFRDGRIGIDQLEHAAACKVGLDDDVAVGDEKGSIEVTIQIPQTASRTQRYLLFNKIDLVTGL